MINKKIIVSYVLAAFFVTGCGKYNVPLEKDVRCQHLPSGATCNIDPDNDTAAFPRFVYDRKTGKSLLGKDGEPQMGGYCLPPNGVGVFQLVFEKPVTIDEFIGGQGKIVAGTYSEAEALALRDALTKKQKEESQRLAKMGAAARKKAGREEISGVQLAVSNEAIAQYSAALGAKKAMDDVFGALSPEVPSEKSKASVSRQEPKP